MEQGEDHILLTDRPSDELTLATLFLLAETDMRETIRTSYSLSGSCWERLFASTSILDFWLLSEPTGAYQCFSFNDQSPHSINSSSKEMKVSFRCRWVDKASYLDWFHVRVNPTTATGFNLLKKLYLRHGTLTQDAIQIIADGCPVLRELTFDNCNLNKDLTVIAVTHPTLSSLMFIERIKGIKKRRTAQMSNTVLRVSANLSFLRLDSDSLRKTYRFEGLSSVFCASIGAITSALDGDRGNEFLEQIFGSIRHVESLVLSAACVLVCPVTPSASCFIKFSNVPYDTSSMCSPLNVH